jgi:hypothetical protein
MMMIALQVFAGLPQSAYAQTAAAPATTTPIKHVIVIIGENRTFDHVYGTYTPKEGETVSNLLSKASSKPTASPVPTTPFLLSSLRWTIRPLAELSPTVPSQRASIARFPRRWPADLKLPPLPVLLRSRL